MVTSEWETITRQLQDPFDPHDVDFRVQKGTTVVAYVDARTVAKRLDDVVGPQHWTFDWEVIGGTDAKGEIQHAKGILTVHGVTKCDIGDASTFDASKGAVSDALKRSAVLFGVGRYLYEIPAEKVQLQGDKPTPAALHKLRSALPKPANMLAMEGPPVPVAEDAYLPHRRQDAIVEDAWTTLDRRRENLGITDAEWVQAKKTYTTVAKMAVALDRVEKKRWEGLRMRANEVGMGADEYEFHLQETGGDYQEMQAVVETFAQRDLRMLKGGKAGVH